MAPGMHLRETESEDKRLRCAQILLCVFEIHVQRRTKAQSGRGDVFNFSLFLSWILFLESIIFPPLHFLFFLSLLSFFFLASIHSVRYLHFHFHRGDNAGTAAGTHRKQVTSSHAYVKK